MLANRPAPHFLVGAGHARVHAHGAFLQMGSAGRCHLLIAHSAVWDFADKVRSYEKHAASLLASALAFEGSSEMAMHSKCPVQEAEWNRSFRG